MCTSWAIQSVAASLDEGLSARFAVNPNKIRSTRVASTRLPESPARIAVSMPSLCHRPSRTKVPPIGRESVKVMSAGPVNAAASVGSRSLVSAATRRSTAARSSSSSRPNECNTFVRDIPAAGSHSLWASCR